MRGGKKIAEPPRSTNACTCLAASPSGSGACHSSSDDLVPVDGRQLDRRRRLRPRTATAGSGEIAAASCSGRAACGSSATMIARRGAGWSKTNQKSLSAGLASAGIETRPQPRSWPSLERDAMVLELGLRPGQLDRHLGPRPVDLELDRDRSRLRVCSSLARQLAARPAARPPSPVLLAADVGHPHRPGCPAPSGDRRAGGTEPPAATRGTPSRSACQRPLSAFQSFSRRSEQIQISVRPVLLALM